MSRRGTHECVPPQRIRMRIYECCANLAVTAYVLQRWQLPGAMILKRPALAAGEAGDGGKTTSH
jgi:hypothetical protein